MPRFHLRRKPQTSEALTQNHIYRKTQKAGRRNIQIKQCCCVRLAMNVFLVIRFETAGLQYMQYITLLFTVDVFCSCSLVPNPTGNSNDRTDTGCFTTYRA